MSADGQNKDPSAEPEIHGYPADREDRPGFPLLARRLRQARVDAGLDQEGAAAQAGVTRGAWGHWEAGRRAPTRSAEELAKVSAVVGADPTWLLGLSDERRPWPPGAPARIGPAPRQEVSLEDAIRAGIEVGLRVVEASLRGAVGRAMPQAVDEAMARLGASSLDGARQAADRTGGASSVGPVGVG